MMRTNRQVAIRDLGEEAKKRIVMLLICVVGLSYLMSLTSSSVLVNLPVAASLIIFLWYMSLDFDMRRKVAAYNSKLPSANTLSQKKPIDAPKIVDRSEWRRKVNSPVVEDALDHFTRHLISEWVTDLWYSRITPDKEAPEELVLIINGVLGEISCRLRNINLIKLLTRKFVKILSSHLELFRRTRAKIEKQKLDSLTLEQQDIELKAILAAENELHPALFSAAAEHKVLQHIMDNLVSLTFKHEELQCSFFRYTARELLACAVMRPVINLVNPRFINERIESVVISKTKAAISVTTTEETSRSNGSSKISSDHFSPFVDPSVTGVELVQLNNGQSKTAADKNAKNKVIEVHQSKDPLLSLDTRSTRSWSSLPSDSVTCDGKGIQQQRSGGEWGAVLDLASHRKTQALAPENFDNIWAKGRNYKKDEGVTRFIEQDVKKSSVRTPDRVNQLKVTSKQNDKLDNPPLTLGGNDRNYSTTSSVSTFQEDDNDKLTHLEEFESDSSSSYTTEDEQTDNITGIGSPGTKVWDGKTIKKSDPSHIRHPLESFEGQKKGRKSNIRFQRLSRSQTGMKISRRRGQKEPVWQEVERTSFLSGDGRDILKPKGYGNFEESSDDSDMEISARPYSVPSASSSARSNSILDSHRMEIKTQNSMLGDSFMKLRCEVLCASIVKSGSRTFAVYSVSVTDINNHSWSIKRRFRHFEELHRRLKEYPEYNLHLPPKHFLSPALDLLVIQERCKLLDNYLKKLLQLPTISKSIEVWDFLSIDSQTYIFSNSITVIESLPVDLEDKPAETSLFKREDLGAKSKVAKPNSVPDGSKLNTESTSLSPVKKLNQELIKAVENRGSDSDSRAQTKLSSLENSEKTTKKGEVARSSEPVDVVPDSNLHTEESVPPNLSEPILDLVDVIFQLQDGGWIRRNAFWVAKQILQLGMGDALDDWLIEKIQPLRKGSEIASGINRIEQILWPDGIFLTKHPKRQKPPVPTTSSQDAQGKESSPSLDDLQQQEATRREKFVYELMIDNAPAVIVNMVGRKEYEHCAKDLYYFLQSSVCMKQLVLDLIKELLLAAFPELDYTFKQIYEEKHKFGEFKKS